MHAIQTKASINASIDDAGQLRRPLGSTAGHRRAKAPARPRLTGARRLVLKVGTRVVTDPGGRLAEGRVRHLVALLARLRQGGHEVLLVSSGAVCLGSHLMGLERPPLEAGQRRVAAAVGQARLVALYQEALAHHGLLCGQVLLTQGDFDDRPRYLELRRTLDTLLTDGAVPILNENDAVAREQPALAEGRPVFGDNDRLAALVASKLDAHLLVLLTDVDGVFDRPPNEPGARRLATLADDQPLDGVLGDDGEGVGRGGMASKVEAASVAARGGCHAVIASGHRPEVLGEILAGADVGTWFPARGTLRARRRWIAFAASPRGVLTLDAGAVEALRSRRASLLPVGVRGIAGEFKTGEVVELRDLDGVLVGRGIALYDSSTVRRWLAGECPADLRHPNALIRRTHVVLEAAKETQP